MFLLRKVLLIGGVGGLGFGERFSLYCSVVKLLGGRLLEAERRHAQQIAEAVRSVGVSGFMVALGKFLSRCAPFVQLPLSWTPPNAVLRLELFRVPHEPCHRVRRGAGSSLTCAALRSSSESSMAAEFLRVRVHDGPLNPGDEAPVVNFRWRGASSEPVHHCVSASMDTAHVGLVTPRCGGLGQRLCPPTWLG